VVLGPGAAAVRRNLGAMAWAVFEELAGRAEASEHGWLCVISVRELAQGVGVNKDTVGRALVALESAGLLRREVVVGASSSVPAGYRLVVPVGVELSCPGNGDTARRPGNGDTARRPGNGDTARRPGNGDTARRPGNGDTARSRLSSPSCAAASGTDAYPGPASLADCPTEALQLDQRSPVGTRHSRRAASRLTDPGGQGSLFDASSTGSQA